MAVTFLDAPRTILEDARSGVAGASSRILVLDPARPRLDAAPILLDQPQLLIGSGAECPIRLAENGINSRHALLLRDGPQVIIKALDRRTWLNGYPVTESRLREGDLLAIGPVEFRVRRAHADELIGNLPAEPARSQPKPSHSRGDEHGDAELTLLDSGRSLLEAGRSQLEAIRSLLESERSQVEAERTQITAERTQVETARSRLDSERSQFDLARALLRGRTRTTGSGADSSRREPDRVGSRLCRTRGRACRLGSRDLDIRGGSPATRSGTIAT